MSNPQEEDNKPIDQEAHIIRKVTSQDGDEVFMKMKKSTPLKRLMNVYCDRRGLTGERIWFHVWCDSFPWLADSR